MKYSGKESANPVNSPHTLRLTVYASLFAALTAVGAFLAIPIGPVPVVLQNFFIFLTGLLLGPRWALASVGVYLTAGGLGLPVFAGGTGGIGRFVGPTGGYLIGYLPAVWVIGRIAETGRYHPFWNLIGLICGALIVYISGVPWLKVLTGMSWVKTLSVGMLPFLIGDALKIAAAVPIAKALRPIINKEG
jgi:biotin transport system substrate-specific component